MVPGVAVPAPVCSCPPVADRGTVSAPSPARPEGGAPGGWGPEGASPPRRGSGVPPTQVMAPGRDVAQEKIEIIFNEQFEQTRGWKGHRIPGWAMSLPSTCWG